MLTRQMKNLPAALCVLFLGLLLMPFEAMAQDGSVSSGDTAWIITATALVLFMSLPGLALFYAGLARSKNVLSVMMQVYVIACLATVVWFAVGYSIAFAEGNAWWGGLSKAFLAGVTADSVTGSIPETVFFAFQMTFAIITPGLIVGAYVERIKFSTVIVFSALWLIVVYAPVTHWVWGGGWLAALGVADFAGGLVVHVTAGVSAIVVVVFLGARRGFPDDTRPPHNSGMVMMGAAMLWVGWFGFNAGSALAADASAGMALVVTHISAAVASLTWMTIEWVRYGKPTLVGTVTGTIAGLATITPAAGVVGPMGAFVIGIAAGAICFTMVQVVKQTLKFDDTLDVFAVHGIGGGTGILLMSVLAFTLDGRTWGSETITSIGDAFVVQAIGLGATVVWAGLASVVLIWISGLLTGGSRVNDEDETLGLDLATHGERGYDLT